MIHKMLQSKKGVFLLLMTLMVFMILTFAYIKISQKYGKVEQHFGDAQLGLLKAYEKGERDALSVEAAGGQDLLQDVIQLSLFAKSSCGEYFGVPVWYKQRAQGACLPGKDMLKSQLDTMLNEQLKGQFTTLGISPVQYDTSILESTDRTTIAAIALAPEEIPLACTKDTQNCGTYATKLSFTRTIPYSFADYAAVKGILTRKDGLFDTLLACMNTSSLQDCAQQNIDAFDNSDLDFSADCDAGPQDAVYVLLEGLNDCASSSDTDCRCGAFSPPTLERIRHLLGNEFQIELTGDTRMVSLVVRGQALLTAPLPQVNLCSFEHIYGTQLGASTDLNEVINPSVTDATIAVKSMLIGPDALQVSVNSGSFASLEHPYYPLFKHGSSLCFVPVGMFSQDDYASLPSCKLPEKKTVKLCATSKKYTLPYFNPITQKFSFQPVVYRFAVDIE